MRDTIYAAFDDVNFAEKAVGALMDHGALPGDISLVLKGSHTAAFEREDRERSPSAEGYAAMEPGYVNRNVVGVDAERYATGGTRPMADAKFDEIASEEIDAEDHAKQGITTTTQADAVAGAIKGAEIGVGVGVLAALFSVAVPGIGLVILGGGSLATALAGTVATAAVATAGAGAAAGAVTGYLKDQGVEETAVHDYVKRLEGGGAVLGVTLPSGAVGEVEARHLLEKYGATTIQHAKASNSAYIH